MGLIGFSGRLRPGARPVWSPRIVDGLAQIERCARKLLSIHPSATDEMVSARLKGRMDRQRRLLREGRPRCRAAGGHDRPALCCRFRRDHGRTVRTWHTGRQARSRDASGRSTRGNPGAGGVPEQDGVVVHAHHPRLRCAVLSAG
jgi:Domain of unknown function (DUF5753)